MLERILTALVVAAGIVAGVIVTLALIILLMLAGAAFDGARAAPDERAIAAKAHAMLAWIGERSDQSVEGVEIRIAFRSPEAVRQACGRELALGCFAAGTILLRDDFRPGIDDAWLLHELVHLVQWENGNTLDDDEQHCFAEKEAYELQVRWAHAFSGHIPSMVAYATVVGCVWSY